MSIAALSPSVITSQNISSQRAVSDTDKKIYGLVVLGRVLQVVAALAAVATIAFVCASIYWGALGLIPAVALSVLGHRLATPNNTPKPVPLPMPTPKVDAPSRSSRASEEERLPKGPFLGVGLKRTGNNCWANACMQLFHHLPNYRNALHADHQEAHAFLNDMAAAETHKRCVASLDSQTIRTLVHGLSMGRISSSSAVQQDPSEALAFLLEGSDRNNPPFFYLREEINGALSGELDVKLDLTQKGITFDDAMHLFFRGDPLNNPNTHARNRGRYTGKHFFAAPNEFLVQMNRFKPTMHNPAISVKINDPCAVPLEYGLPNRFIYNHPHPDSRDHRYRCDFIIKHIGATPNGGHYVAWARQADGSWLKLDDWTVTRDAPDVDSSYLYHFTLIA